MRKILLLLLIALIVLELSYSSMFVVHEGQRGIILRFGKLIGNSYYNPGLHIKIPFVDKVKNIDARIHTMEKLVDSFTTIEYQDIIVDSYIKWRIIDFSRYYLATCGEVKQTAEVLMKCKFLDILRSKLIFFDLKEILRSYFSNTIMIDIRESLNNGTSDDVIHIQYTTTDNAIAYAVASLERYLQQIASFNHNSMAALGIQVLDVRIKQITLEKEFYDAIYQRMRAECDAVTRLHCSQVHEKNKNFLSSANYEIERNLADAERIIISCKEAA